MRLGPAMTRSRPVGRYWIGSLTLVVAMATACGTTVSGSRLATAEAPSSAAGAGGLSLPGTTAATGSAVHGVPAPVARAAAAGQVDSRLTGPAGATGRGVVPGTGPTATGGAANLAGTRSSGPVQLGIEYFDSSQAVSSGKAVGYTVSPGDPYAEAKALVGWINRHGGLGGHQVDPVYWQFSNTGSEDTEEQSACQTWTQDHHVAAVIWPNNFSSSNLLAGCLAHAGVMLTGGADSYLNSPQLGALGGYLQTPYMFAGDRMYKRLIDRLVSTHWFAPGGKVAVLSDDGPTYAANVQAVDQALGQHGLTAADHATLSTSSPAQDSTDCQSAGLRFAADHITNIVVIDDGARAFLYCTPVFRSQNYYPKFSMTSYDSPSTLQTLIPASSLRGSAGIGWEPVNDVSPATLNAAGRQCVSIMRSAGENVTASAFTEAIAFAYCDGFFFLHRAYGQATDLAPTAVQRAIAALGASYLSPITFTARFAPGRYDGVGAAADLTYEQSCSCYRYRGEPSSSG